MSQPSPEAEAAAAAVKREVIEDFLKTCTDALRSDACRATMKESTGRPGAQLVSIQKEVWDSLGIRVDVGQLSIGRIERHFPDDHEALVALRKEFGEAIDAAYLRYFGDRRPATLEKKAKLRRNNVLDFLDACRVLLDSSGTRDRLRARIKETGAMPEDTLNEIHGEAMEIVGFDREHGQKAFEAFGKSKELARDKDVAAAVARWRQKNSAVCLKLLAEFQKEGGEIKATSEVKDQLLNMRAKEGLDAMSFEERSKLLEKNAKKVNIFRNLPDEARLRYVEKLSDDEKLELCQTEILMVTVMNSRQQRMQGNVE